MHISRASKASKMEIESYLPQNIRFLRKARRWSQEELAAQLGIKRSNIAAYEVKNVEPRLGLILKMAKLFDVDMAQLIHTNIEAQGGVTQTFQTAPLENKGLQLPTALLSELYEHEALQDFAERSLSLRKMLEGFRVFYRHKAQQAATDSGSKVDIHTFIDLIDHTLRFNESLLEGLQQQEE